MTVRFNVLGPLEVVADGRVVPVSSARQRSLLAALLVDANRVVTTHDLVLRVWGDEQPAAARETLHSNVMRLRRTLGGAGSPVRTRPEGYLVEVADGALDTDRFTALVDRARAADPATATILLREALALWRGDALSDVPSDVLRRDVVPALTERRLAATELRIDADLALGRHQDVVAELADLTARHPLRERFWAQRMLALYRCDRQAEALACYQSVGAVLAAELGIDPGPALRHLRQAVLTNDPALDVPTSLAPQPKSLPADSGDPVPRQLPAGLGRLPGRERAVEELDRWLATPTDDWRLRLVAIVGQGGIGKTALAVHWAQRVRDRFPDGQLYVDLRGFGPGAAMSPAGVLERLLRGLRVPTDAIPVDVEDRAALLRTTAGGRRVLIVLDNARDSAQVRDLLPGPGCLIVVTSRNQMRGLAVREGAHRITLGPLPATAATALLSDVADQTPDGVDRTVVTRLVDLCAGLPLALRVVAERMARDGQSLPDVVAELTDSRPRLDALSSGDDELTDVRTVLSWSYRALEPAAARAFRLLGARPGAEISLPAAAALLAEPEPTTRRLLDRLVGVHLLERRGRNRYGQHDLLRAYAAERFRADENADTNANTGADTNGGPAAVRRILDWYLHTAYRASDRLYPTRWIDMPDSTVTPLDFADAADAFAWFDDEHVALIAAMDMASTEADLPGYAWRLAWTMWELFDKRYVADRRIPVFAAGLAAARREGSLVGEAYMLNGLGSAHHDHGDNATAVRHHEEQLTIARLAGNRELEATALTNLVATGRYHDDPEPLLVRLGLAAGIFDELGQHANAIAVLNNMAVQLNRLGRFTEALSHVEHALRMLDRRGITRGRTQVITTIGVAHAGLGRHETALTYFRRALAANREYGFRPLQGNNLQHMGDSYAAMGDRSTARELWRQALEIYRETHAVNNVGSVLARLAGADEPFEWTAAVDGPPGSQRRWAPEG